MMELITIIIGTLASLISLLGYFMFKKQHKNFSKNIQVERKGERSKYWKSYIGGLVTAIIPVLLATIIPQLWPKEIAPKFSLKTPHIHPIDSLIIIAGNKSAMQAKPLNVEFEGLNLVEGGKLIPNSQNKQWYFSLKNTQIPSEFLRDSTYTIRIGFKGEPFSDELKIYLNTNLQYTEFILPEPELTLLDTESISPDTEFTSFDTEFISPEPELTSLEPAIIISPASGKKIVHRENFPVSVDIKNFDDSSNYWVAIASVSGHDDTWERVLELREQLRKKDDEKKEAELQKLISKWPIDQLWLKFYVPESPYQSKVFGGGSNPLKGLEPQPMVLLILKVDDSLQRFFRRWFRDGAAGKGYPGIPVSKLRPNMILARCEIFFP